MEITIHNTHLHTFTGGAVPREFLPFGLVRLLARRSFIRGLARIVNKINPWSSDDVFDRYVRFVEIGTLGSQEEIFRFVQGFYPEGARFVVLSMDMEYMGAGAVPQPFEEQMRELGALKKTYGDLVLPFVAADPRRPGLSDIVKQCMEEYGFAGVKIYPKLGYFPYDRRLAPVYRYCSDHRKPVVSHVSTGGIAYRGTVTESMIEPSRIDKGMFGTFFKKNPCAYFTHPLHYRELAIDFPELHVSLGHFGGDKEWERYLDDSWRMESGCGRIVRPSWFSLVLELVKERKNLFTDIAYTMYTPRFFSLLKVVLQDPAAREKVLFGSDYYMVQQDASERNFALDVRGYLGEEDFKLIAEENPRKFFFEPSFALCGTKRSQLSELTDAR